MAQTFIHTLFGPGARALQEAAGSRGAYARMEEEAGPLDILTDREIDFIVARDSYLHGERFRRRLALCPASRWAAGHSEASSGKSHRLHRLSWQSQYLSTAHVAADDRVALFLMDYPNRRRLKIIGHAHASEEPAVITALMPPDYAALPERAFLIDVIGFDWNCPQHITPRFTEEEVRRASLPLIDEIAALRSRIAQLEGNSS
ncbi:pyridoxamine 5'-phosphate oxidase family protein [Novosphingobium profundi]|uniref:pyridoxamine 5'-phosphate oxidase family protein n=1 Tax=Novosphingobium profundi TaxID=1774954 RepID=UPI001FE4644B|nr:pyridoxamine 5'-phosphate oxidase family protein [Novosphingobium profundi]